MRFYTFFVFPIVGAAALRVNRRQNEPAAINATNATAISNSFIIEYTAGHAKRQNSITNAKDIKVIKTFDSDIFSGVSIETGLYNIDTLQKLPGVARAWSNERITLAPLQPQAISDLTSYVNYTTHNATGVNKVHAQGFYGKGSKVGIVDTGTWYKHPALGGGFGPGFKVAGGHDFVGDGYWPSSGDKEPDSDPIDQLGHGTHVAGIIGGKTENFIGVAPEATLYSYKVFAQDSTDEATLIDAFLTAYNDGVDIITASIGVANGWEDNVWGEVASRIVDEGVIVTISAGNDGDKGPIEIGNGSAGKNVIAVASLETEVLPLIPFGVNFTVDDQTNSTVVGYIPSTDNFPSEIVGWPIVPLTLDTTIPNDGCTPWPAGTMNLTGKIPLVRRGTCTFTTKQGYLEELGAEYILFYNNESPIITPGTLFGSSLIALVPADIGAAIIGIYKAGGTVTGDFSKDTSIPLGLPDAVANKPSTYTSWGPLYGLEMKPDIAGPGGNIFSTWPDDSWAILSGTSMSCPYVAGVAALYVGAYGGRETHGKDFAKKVSQRIISSGVSIPWSDGTTKDYGFDASVAQVGNGLVDAFKVLNYNTELSFNKFELNDTRYFSRYHDLTVTNNGKKPASYSFSTESAAGIDLIKEESNAFGLTKAVKRFTDLAPVSYEPKINLPRNFTLQPGQSKTVSISFDNPDNLGWNATLLPLYSGKVVLTSDIDEVLSVPYMGLAADLNRQLDPIYSTGYPWAVSDTTRQNLNQKPYFSFNLSLTRQDFPMIYSDIIWGSKEVRWDIYEPGWSESDWSYPPIAGENGYIGAATFWVGMSGRNYFDPRLYDPNDTLTYPIVNVPMGAPNFWWFGKLGNGSQIALGNYTMRFATLLPFGNPVHADNWNVFKTPEIQVTGHY